MTPTVKLNQLRTVTDDLDYPLSKAEAHEALTAVTLQYADGREPLSDVLDRSHEDRFETADDLESEVYNHLPTAAVGEPGQSEGEG